MPHLRRSGALVIIAALGLVAPATAAGVRPPAALARQLFDQPAAGASGSSALPPLGTPGARTSVCAYLAVTDFTRAIDPGFASHATPPGTPSPARTSLAASAYCHPLPPLAPVGRP